MAALHPFGFVGGADPFRELRRLQDELDASPASWPLPLSVAFRP